MVVLQVLQSNGAQQTGDAAARPAAVTEAAIEAATEAALEAARAGQRQGLMGSSQNDVDAGEATTQQMLNQVAGLQFHCVQELLMLISVAAGQGLPQGNKRQAGKKRKGVPSSAADTGTSPISTANTCLSHCSKHPVQP